MRPPNDQESISAAAAIIFEVADQAAQMQQQAAKNIDLKRDYLQLELNGVCVTSHLLRRVNATETILEIAVGLYHETRHSEAMRGTLLGLYEEVALTLPAGSARTNLMRSVLASENQDSPFYALALDLLRSTPLRPGTAP